MSLSFWWNSASKIIILRQTCKRKCSRLICNLHNIFEEVIYIMLETLSFFSEWMPWDWPPFIIKCLLSIVLIRGTSPATSIHNGTSVVSTSPGTIVKIKLGSYSFTCNYCKPFTPIFNINHVLSFVFFYIKKTILADRDMVSFLF